MIREKNKLLLSLTLLSVLLLSLYAHTAHALDKKITKTIVASAATLLSINELWSWLSARSGSSDIKKRDDNAAIARQTIKNLWPKWKNSSLSKKESKALRTAIWHIIDAEWIGYYKTPKNRISIAFKTSDGRAIDIDAMEKSNGSVGLGKIFQRIMGLGESQKLFTSVIMFFGGVLVLDKFIRRDGGITIFMDWKKAGTDLINEYVK